MFVIASLLHGIVIRRGSLVVLTLAFVACGDGTPKLVPDQGGSDLMWGEQIRPPDMQSGDAARSGNIGDPCEPTVSGQCTGGTVCLNVGGGVGVCTISGCQLEDIATPASEDDCPTIAASDQSHRKTVCTEVSVAAPDGGYRTDTFCFPQCTVRPDANDCAVVNPQLACDPASLLQNGYREVCMLPACKVDSDCGNRSLMHPDSICHVATGTCHTRGTVGVEIGSPCKVNSDCGPYQFCFPEQKDDKGNRIVEGGYCTIIGCMHFGPWTCPESSKCFVLASSKDFSLCLATGCNPLEEPKQDGCRDEASAGQYDCRVEEQDSYCWLDPSPGK